MITCDDDNVSVVESRAQLIAAIQAGACNTFAEARKAPFTVQLGSTRYSFIEGLTQQRADYICANARHTHPLAFKVATV